jgi:hypothetical protein
MSFTKLILAFLLVLIPAFAFAGPFLGASKLTNPGTLKVLP